MATMNISLPDALKSWVEDQVAKGEHASASDFVRDMIRNEKGRQEAIDEMIALAEEGHASGVSKRTPQDIVAEVKARLMASAKRRAV
jgi:antitoxin ParD1/3/4